MKYPNGSLFWLGFDDGLRTAARRMQSGETPEEILAGETDTGAPGALDREYVEPLVERIAELEAEVRRRPKGACQGCGNSVAWSDWCSEQCRIWAEADQAGAEP